MKNLKALVAVTAVALSSVSHAAVSTTAGQADPSPINASGTIAKYVHFTETDTTVEMPLGAPMFIGSVQSLPADGATIRFDSNTHLSLVVTNGGNLTTTNTGGAHVDSLPTTFIIGVQGRGVKTGVIADAGTLLTASNGGFTDLAATAAGASSSFNFKHGPNSGVRVNVQATRNGVDDHFGDYTTSAVLTWADLG